MTDRVPIALCADDFGIAPGVSRGIADLAMAERLTAVSCMTEGPAWATQAPRLRDFPQTVELGLHVVLTTWDRSLRAIATDAFLGRLDLRATAESIDRQIDAFEIAVGRSPDFIDGHLHVHELPGVRDVVADLWCRRLGNRCWIRNTATGMSRILGRPIAKLRSTVLATLGTPARRRWRRLGAWTNRDFAGVRDFDERHPYRVLMRHFLKDACEGRLVMCHPGIPDAELATQDPVIGQRGEELGYLASSMFIDDMATAGVRLAPLGALRPIHSPTR